MSALLIGASAVGTAAAVPSAPAVAEPQAVRWIRGPDSDRDVLDRWRAGVGPSVVRGQLDSADARGPVAFDELAIVSWNVHVGGGDLSSLLDALRAGRFTEGDSVRHFVLLLQEAFRASSDVPRGEAHRPRRIAPRTRHGGRQDIVEVAREQGLSLVYVPSMANGRDGHEPRAEDRGNAILSSLPLSGATAIELPFEGQRRVAVSATVQAADAAGRAVSLRAVSVHLDNRSGVRRVLHSFGSGRARQAEALAAALMSDSMSAVPTVVAGDLNTWAPRGWERAVTVLRAHFPLGDVVLEPTFAGPFMGIGRALDHMMFRLPTPRRAPARHRGPATDRDVAMPSFSYSHTLRLRDTHGSDHHPLLARLGLSGGA